MTEINMHDINATLIEIREECEKKNADLGKIANLEAVLEKQEKSNQDLMKKINEEKASKEEVEAKFANLEAELKRGSLAGEQKEEASKELKSFEKFLCLGEKQFSKQIEEKTLRTDTDTNGGYLAPSQYVNEIIKEITEISPVRQVARVIRTNSKEIEIPKRTGLVSGGWVGELESSSSSNSSYGMEKITVNKMMVYSDISVEMLQDAAFNMRQEISSDVAEDFAKLEGAAFINGNGVKKPEGLLSNADISSFNSGAAAALTADSLFEIQGELKAGYDLAFMMNRKTLHQHVRTLKDNNGQYLLQLGLGALPNTIAGLPYVLANDMPDVAANAFPILIGDYRKAFYIVDSAEVTVLEDPYTQAISGVRRFNFYKRVGGQVVLPEAVKKLKIAV